MIPARRHEEFDPASREEDIYNALAKLSDDYWVIHSLRFVNVDEGRYYHEHEADFIIFHKDLGVLVIEAKNGHVYTENGAWYYQSGKPIPNGGPYQHAALMKWEIKKRFEDLDLDYLLPRCKLMHAAWLVGLGSHDLGGLEYSTEAPREITLCGSDLKNPEFMIKQIMNLEIEAKVKTNLTDDEAQTIIRKIICPQLNIKATTTDYGYSDYIFKRLLDEQIRVLNFLQDQQTAAINGAAGTGKTYVAIEHATRLAGPEDRVLFLCYNKLLREMIAEELRDVDYVDVYTIDAYATKITGKSDYERLAEKLSNDPSLFQYKHLIIDEGQDFGKEEILEAEILDILQMLIDDKEGTMYFFYDKRQLVQGVKLPACITDADCKLTLYRNCRNTENIARCSFNSLNDDSGKRVMLSSEAGTPPELKASKEKSILEAYVDSQIKKLKDKGINEIVVLTCKTIESSSLKDSFREKEKKGEKEIRWKKTSAKVHTCRKFKGLEAEAVILIDVDKTLWKKPTRAYDPKEGMIFYTGASRAKFELKIAANVDKSDCEEILSFFGVKKTAKPIRKLASVLGATLANE